MVNQHSPEQEISKPKSKPLWMDYVDLAAKVTLPIAVLAATILFNSSQRREQDSREDFQRELTILRESRKACIDHQFKLVELPRETPTEVGDVLWEAIQKTCTEAKERILTRTSQAVANTTKDASVFGEAQEHLGKSLPVTQTAKGDAPAPVRDEPAIVQNYRVYIQIHSESQRDAALKIRSSLDDSTFNGYEVAAPGVELPKNPKARVNATELRCAGADCKDAGALAAYVSKLLNGQPVRVRDISKLVGRNSKARPGHYELWFGPGPIAVTNR